LIGGDSDQITGPIKFRYGLKTAWYGQPLIGILDVAGRVFVDYTVSIQNDSLSGCGHGQT